MEPTIRNESRYRKIGGDPTPDGDVLERLAKLQILYETSSMINSTMEPREVISRVLDEAVRIMGATSGSLRLIDPERRMLRLEVAIGKDLDAIRAKELPLGKGITGWVALYGKPLLAPDVTREERYFPIRKDVLTELAVPLIIEEQVIGVLNVDSTRKDAFGETDLELLKALAHQSSRVIYDSKLHAQVKRKALELSSLFSVSQDIVSSLDLDEVLKRITRKAVELMALKLCSLMLLDETGLELSIKAVHGASESYIRKPNLKVADSLLGRVIREKTALTVEDVRDHPEFKYSRLAREEGLVSLLSVPMVYQEQVVGLLNVYTGKISPVRSRGDRAAHGPCRPVCHRHRKRPFVRQRGCGRGAHPAVRKALDPGGDGRRDRSRSQKPLDGHRDAHPFPPRGIRRRRPEKPGHPRHRGQDHADGAYGRPDSSNHAPQRTGIQPRRGRAYHRGIR